MNREQTLKEKVYKTFLLHQNFSPSDMAKHLNEKYNSVKAIYSKLFEQKILKRESRGNYSPNIEGILLLIMDRLDNIERKVKELI